MVFLDGAYLDGTTHVIFEPFYFITKVGSAGIQTPDESGLLPRRRHSYELLESSH